MPGGAWRGSGGSSEGDSVQGADASERACDWSTWGNGQSSRISSQRSRVEGGWVLLELLIISRRETFWPTRLYIGRMHTAADLVGFVGLTAAAFTHAPSCIQPLHHLRVRLVEGNVYFLQRIIKSKHYHRRLVFGGVCHPRRSLSHGHGRLDTTLATSTHAAWRLMARLRVVGVRRRAASTTEMKPMAQ